MRDRTVAYPEIERPVGLPETKCAPTWVPAFDGPDHFAEDAPDVRAERWVSVFTTRLSLTARSPTRAQFAFAGGEEYTFEAALIEGPGCQDFSFDVYVWQEGAPCYALAAFGPESREVRVWAAEGGGTVLVEADAKVSDESAPDGWTTRTMTRELFVTPTSAPPANQMPGR